MLIEFAACVVTAKSAVCSKTGALFQIEKWLIVPDGTYRFLLVRVMLEQGESIIILL